MQVRFPTFDLAGSVLHWGDDVEAVNVFDEQENQHLELHTDHLEMLEANGYPRIREYEAAFEREAAAWLAMGEIAGDHFTWMRDRDDHPADVPEPAGYAPLLAAYS